MPDLHTVTSVLEACNLHFCLYAAFGCILILRGLLARRERKLDEAREHVAHGIVNILLALL